MFLIGVGALYGAGLLLAAGAYFYTVFTIEKVQPIPASWTFKQRLLGWAGANHFEEQRHSIVCQYYERLLNELIHGSDGKVVNLNEQTPEWLAGYADIAIRLGLSQEMLDERESAKEALSSGLSIPYGQKNLKSRASIQLAQYELEEGNLQNSESHLVNALNYESAMNKGKVSLNASNLTEESVRAATELGKTYVKQNRLEEALALFLSSHKAISSNNFKPEKCFAPTLVSYISEVLWAMGNEKDGIIWAESAYHESNLKGIESVECGLCAKMSALNLSSMYKNVNMNTESERFSELAQSQEIMVANPSKFESLWSSFV